MKHRGGSCGLNNKNNNDGSIFVNSCRFLGSNNNRISDFSYGRRSFRLGSIDKLVEIVWYDRTTIDCISKTGIISTITIIIRSSSASCFNSISDFAFDHCSCSSVDKCHVNSNCMGCDTGMRSSNLSSRSFCDCRISIRSVEKTIFNRRYVEMSISHSSHGSCG
ncbi:unnamed protein product [Schistosoma guineensis]|nr:unnamed protein product [Schistosoma guineensis]